MKALRLTAIHNVTGISRNIEAGLELVEFAPEAQALIKRAGAESVLPNWLERLGYPEKGQEVVDVFNIKIGPYVGLEVQLDAGSERGCKVVDVPITFRHPRPIAPSAAHKLPANPKGRPIGRL